MPSGQVRLRRAAGAAGEGMAVTEAEWLACENPASVLEYLRERVADRKLRLFACGCCRAIWHLIDDGHCRQAVEIAERFADGQSTQRQVAAAYRRASGATTAANKAAAMTCDALIGTSTAIEIAVCAADAVAFSARQPETAYEAETRNQARLWRELVGNPSRTGPAVDPAWLAWQGGAVTQLARAAHEERRLPEGTLDPARLAVLADALEDAGCADAELLGHLRGPGVHCRGCWALDLLLAKF